MRLGVFLIAIYALTACGSGQSAHALNDEDKSLTNTPISFAAATGETSRMVEVTPCPFVSDAVILASVRSGFEITRREVSNTNCRWAYNAGFAINVTIEDISTAVPVLERRYNAGVDPELSPQEGPGTNAVVLNDTAWGKSLPFAYSFEKDGKLVFMRYTGFKTDARIMRTAANEIARRMASASEVEPQRRHLEVDFEPCAVWTTADLRTVFGTDDQSRVAAGRRSTSACSWDIFEDGVAGRRTAAFNISKPERGKKQEYEYSSYSPYSADGETHYLRKSSSDFGLYIHLVTPRPQGLVHVTVSDANGDATSVAKVLQNNLLNRMVP